MGAGPYLGGPDWAIPQGPAFILKNYGVNKTNFKISLQVQKSIMKFRDCNPYTHFFLHMFCLYIYLSYAKKKDAP